MPDPARHDILEQQRDDIRVLEADAHTRDWPDEATRHRQVADTLDNHLKHLAPTTTP